MEPGKKTSLIKDTKAQIAAVFPYVLWLCFAAWVYSLSFIIDNYLSHYSSYKSVADAYQQALHDKESSFFSSIENDAQRIHRFANNNHTVNDVEAISHLPFHLFVYEAGRSSNPIFWSTNQVVPPSWMVETSESGEMLEYGNGEYEFLKRRIKHNGQQIDVVGLILLHRGYFIENERLKKSFPGFPELEGRMLFSSRPSPYPIYGVGKRPIFYLQEAVTQPFRYFSWLSFAIQLVATILLIFLVSRVANDYIRRNDAFAGFLVFCAGFTFLWVSIRWLGVPINLEQFTWLTGSNEITLPPSELLNLLQNALFVFWLGLFVTFHSQQIGRMLTGVDYRFKILLSLLLVTSAISVHYGIIEKICKLYLSNSVALDFNNFFSLNYTTAIAFMVMFLMMLAHLMLVRFFARSLMFITGGNIRFVIIAMVAGGLLGLTLFNVFEFKMQLLFSIIWLAGFCWYICRFPRVAFPVSSGRMVMWLFIYAISAGVLLSFLSFKRMQNRLYQVGKTLMLQNDQTSEFLVRFASGGIRKMDWYSLMERAGEDSVRSMALRDSITQQYFSGYLNRFTTDIFFFNRRKQGIYNPSAETFESLNTLYLGNSKQEGFPWIAFFEESYDRFGYIMRFEVEHPELNDDAGSVFVVTRSALTRNAMLAPELFRQLQDFAIDLPAGFSYAWYKQGRLAEQYRNYPFPAMLPPALEAQPSMMQRAGLKAEEVWLDAGSGTYLVVAGESNTLIGWITLVAYVFCAFLFIFLVLRLMAGITLTNSKRTLGSNFFRPLTLSIQNQIRLTIITILAISFIIIAFITINFFIQQFRSSTEEKLSKAAGSVSSELKQDLPADLASFNPADRKKIMDESLLKISQSLNADINFYDSTGLLTSSTQNILFNREVLSKRMNPLALRQLSMGLLHRFLTTETIGTLTYSNVYQPYIDYRGVVQGYIHVPYFASQNELKQEISNFVVILVNIIAFVFLLSGGLALLISGSITKSFDIISEKMNQLRLSEKNERIEWSGKNEIGTLIQQYNRMVDQLEQSASKLAQSERELAWREMARQVAHEIKNPLTPMKLSLQFLQRAIKEKNGNVEALAERVSHNLVTQIDHLAKIAFEFSQFANIGKGDTEVFNVHDVIVELLQLYSLNENIVLKASLNKMPVLIRADKTQINRLFTNLLQNAVEAKNSNAQLVITVRESLNESKVVFEIADNGPGINMDAREKIFTPNFTTKSSGTGLGLAICKVITERAGGKIWFNTSELTGTSFFVELPVVTADFSNAGQVSFKSSEA